MAETTKRNRAANVNRKATARTLSSAVAHLKRVIGLVVQTHRAYESPQRPDGLKQTDVEEKTKCPKQTMSKLENGGAIPDAKELNAILKACGFNMGASQGGAGLRALLNVLRDHEKSIKTIEEESPP